MKRLLLLVAVCTASFLLMAPTAVYAQHDDPDMEWEDLEEEPASEETVDAYKPPETVYERWGGLTAIKGVVSELVPRVLKDERIKNHFIDINMARWRLKLAGQLAEAAGGPVYPGNSLKDEHQTMGLSEEDIKVMTEHLDGSLDWFEFEQKDKDEFYIKLGLKERPRLVEESQ